MLFVGGVYFVVNWSNRTFFLATDIWLFFYYNRSRCLSRDTKSYMGASL